MKSLILMICFGMLQAQSTKGPMPEWINAECGKRKIGTNEFKNLMQKCSALYKVDSITATNDIEKIGKNGAKSNPLDITFAQGDGNILVCVTNTPFMRSIDKSSSPFVLFYDWEYDAAPDLMFDNLNNKIQKTENSLEVTNSNFEKKIIFSAVVDDGFLVCSRNGKPYALFTLGNGSIDIQGRKINSSDLTGNFKVLRKLYESLVELRMKYYSSQIGLKVYETKAK